TYTQSLTLKMDPRVKTSPESIAQQHAIAMQSYEGMKQVRDALEQVRKIRSQLKDLRDRGSQGALADAIDALERKAAALEGAGGGFRGGGCKRTESVSNEWRVVEFDGTRRRRRCSADDAGSRRRSTASEFA